MPNINNNLRKEIQRKRITLSACPIKEYYKINRILLLCIGLWPYQKSRFRYVTVTFMTIMLVSGIVFQLTTFITTEYNIDIFLHILTYTVPWLAYTLKYNILCLTVRQLRDIMERVYCDWNELHNMQEVKIIKKYSAVAKFLTISTTLFIYISILCFILVQFLPNFFFRIIFNRNESRSRQFPVRIEVFIDQQKYFFPILLQLCIVIVCSLTTVVAAETVNMSHVHHACGLFEIANCRMEQALHRNMIQNIASTTRSLIIRQGIINGFNMYRNATEFVEMLKKNYKWSYSVLLPLGVLSLSVNLYRFSRLIESKEYYEVIVSFLFILGHFWYMFFCNYLGQQIIDHSINVFYRTYNTQWYVAPLEAQKLLLLVMQRTVRHCTIIIDGLFIPSFEGFATLANTSISYFAVILSVL